MSSHADLTQVRNYIGSQPFLLQLLLIMLFTDFAQYWLHRAFHLELFRSVLDYSSDDFRRLVEELASYPPEIVNGLVFADLDFRPRLTAQLLLDAFRRPRGVLGHHLLAAMRHYLRR